MVVCTRVAQKELDWARRLEERSARLKMRTVQVSRVRQVAKMWNEKYSVVCVYAYREKHIFQTIKLHNSLYHG